MIFKFTIDYISSYFCDIISINMLSNYIKKIKKILFNNENSTKNETNTKVLLMDILVNEKLNLEKFNNLEYLDCRRNRITHIIISSKKIKTLFCQHNKFKTLDNLPQQLEELSCSNCPIISLNNLPNKLKILHCACCKITSLDNLPVN